MTTTQTQKEPSREEIERRAYSLYEERGATPGHELDDWLAAEKQVSGPDSSAAPRTPARTEKQTQPPAASRTARRPTDADDQEPPA